MKMTLSADHLSKKETYPIMDALMRTSALLVSNHLVCEGPPFSCTNGLLSLSTMESLYKSYQENNTLNIINQDIGFLADLEKLYQLPLQENVFRMIYIFRNNVYFELTKDHKYPIFQYDPKRVELITRSMTRKYNKPITITMTTCKRFDLFERTMNSILQCVTDITEYVSDWIVVDDNSNAEERTRIRSLYPFIRMIEKGQEEKGHPISMNILQNEITTKYQFHIEDDWEFFIIKPYCKIMMDRLCLVSGVKQVLLNLNYTEDTHTANSIWGAKMVISDPSSRLFVHRYYTGSELEHQNRLLGCANCLYWPHFSFRVGLTDTSIYKELGLFSLTHPHFEMDYAQRYIEKGYKTSFLDGIFCTHIGRRTYERKTEKRNAYDLNEEKQFGETPKIDSEKPVLANTKKQGIVSQDPTPNNSSLVSIEKSKVVEVNVINLKRRTDRLVSFFQRNQKCDIPFKIFEAIDGRTLEPSNRIQSLFSTGDFHYRRGIVGCAMSHIELWKRFLIDPNVNYLVVLEDDIVLTRRFSSKLMHILSSKSENEFDVLFLHFNPYPPYRYSKLYLQYSPVEVEIWSKERSIRENMGSGAAYLLTKNGAKQLLQHIDEKGVYNAIDWVIFKSGIRTGYTCPMMAFAECVQSGAQDTDIQNVYESVSISKWTLQELKKWKEVLTSGLTCSCNKWLESIGIPDSEISNNPMNKIIASQTVDKEQVSVSDKIIITSLSEKTKLKEWKGPFVWYETDNVIFIVPYLYTDETLLQTTCLFGNKLLI
jgi:GR25 family glycosyltransferase involved in LPS biosynthesis